MTDPSPIPPEDGLSEDEARSLRCVAGVMIPASPEHGVPGADDEAVFADIVRSIGRDAHAVRAALVRLDELAGGALADRAPARQADAARRLRDEHPAMATVLAAVVVRCYYRDERVMRSLGMEPRPPYPVGFEVEQGDWSLLDPVRARGRIWRDA